MSKRAHIPAREADRNWVLVGVIIGAHGVKGEVIVKSLMQNPTSIADQGQLYAGAGHDPLRLSGLREMKGRLAARVEGVETRDQAGALKGVELFVRRSDLPDARPGEYYVSDLEGLNALDGSGKRIGIVKTIHDFGAGPLIEIALDAPRKNVGSAPVLPFTASTVPDVNPAAGSVTVLLDEWLDGQIVAAPDGAGGEE